MYIVPYKNGNPTRLPIRGKILYSTNKPLLSQVKAIRFSSTLPLFTGLWSFPLLFSPSSSFLSSSTWLQVKNSHSFSPPPSLRMWQLSFALLSTLSSFSPFKFVRPSENMSFHLKQLRKWNKTRKSDWGLKGHRWTDGKTAMHERGRGKEKKAMEEMSEGRWWMEQMALREQRLSKGN